MNWRSGDIAEAILSCKAKGAIFMVFAYGDDGKSSQLTNLINTKDVSSVLNRDCFVGIKVEGGSQQYRQFTEIYKDAPVPSIYFIGKRGEALLIVREDNGVKSFLEQINTVLQKHGLTPNAIATETFIRNEQTEQVAATPVVPDNVVCENGVCVIKREEKPTTSQELNSKKPEEKTVNTEQVDKEVNVVTSKESAKENVENSEPSVEKVQKLEPSVENEEKAELSPEEKVERAKLLVEKKREDKQKEEKEKERQQEIERRQTGQSVQQLKRWQEDQEMKQALEEREKEKREGQAARQRVLAQIAQDKAERAAKFSTAAPPKQPASTPTVSPKPINTNTARLQFRLPDGRTSTNDFPSSDTLESVHSFIRANLNLPFSTYTLSTTFPRREFTDNDKNQSLLDLELVPTAVILILPTSHGIVTTNSSGGFYGLLWSLFSPILTVFGYLKTFVFGSGPASNPGNEDRNKRASDSSNESRVPPKVRRAGETTVIRKQGNIHRLSNKNDSDDENNTWNGNSTQQM